MRGCPEAMHSQPVHGFPKLLSWKNLTSEETEKKKSLQRAQHCWVHTREPQPQGRTRTDAPLQRRCQYPGQESSPDARLQKNGQKMWRRHTAEQYSARKGTKLGHL